VNVQAQQRLTFGLAIACGVFALLALAFWLGLGRGYGWLPANPDSAPHLPALAQLQQQSFTMPPFDHYVEITQRPLFADDRKPIPPDADGPQSDQAAPPPVPLQVILTGVIITPEVKLAVMHDQASNKDVSLREGMPLPGNQSGWTLVEIQPRKIVVSDANDKTTEVELVAPGTNAPPPPPSPPTQGNAPVTPGVSPQQQQAANDLRARIEARRQELREQAERMRQQNGQPSDSKPDTPQQ
jgi:general secretion pathway protein N